MTAPTPADAFGPRRTAPVLRFDVAHEQSPAEDVAFARGAALVDAIASTGRLHGALQSLRSSPRADLDLNVERALRAHDRALVDLTRLLTALADPAGTPVPSPHARRR